MTEKKTEKKATAKKDVVSVTLIANVKYGSERYKAGDKLELPTADYDSLLQAGVIEEKGE